MFVSEGGAREKEKKYSDGDEREKLGFSDSPFYFDLI